MTALDKKINQLAARHRWNVTPVHDRFIPCYSIVPMDRQERDRIKATLDRCKGLKVKVEQVFSPYAWACTIYVLIWQSGKHSRSAAALNGPSSTPTLKRTTSTATTAPPQSWQHSTRPQRSERWTCSARCTPHEPPPDALAGLHRKAAPPHYPGSRREINRTSTTTNKGERTMKGMTNNQIIMNEAAKLDPATLHAIATAHHTPEQIAAMAANAVTTDENGDEQPATIADVEIILAAAELHTFDYWKKEGKSVKKGETHLIECYLWKYTTRPSKAQREAAEAEGKEAAPAPHFYPTKSHLFSCLQVHDAKQAPAGRFGSVAAIMEYNKKLAAERKAAKAAAEQAASTPAPIITEEHHELPELVHVDPLPTKKASKPAATKKPAPDVLRKAEREAKAAFLAVPETDRKGQAAALDAWRKTRKAVEDAKQAPAAVAVPDEAPVKQLDFESIAAGLLA